MTARRSRIPILLTVAGFALLLCGCRPAAAPETAQTDADSGPATAAEPFVPASTVPETTSAAETEAPPRRVYTEADLHLYPASEGEPEPGKINVAFYPDSIGSDGSPDPDIRVWDSWRIRDPEEIRDICSLILASEYYDAALYGRSLDSMVTEWQAHSDINAVYDNERTRHVDLNRADEGVSYADFWKRAAAEYTEGMGGN